MHICVGSPLFVKAARRLLFVSVREVSALNRPLNESLELSEEVCVRKEPLCSRVGAVLG